MRVRMYKPLLAAGLLAASSAALACSDSSCYPSWKLFAGGSSCENRGFLSPGNDTRTNLLFLLRDRGGASSAGAAYPEQSYDASGYGHTFLNPAMQRAAFYPAPAGSAEAASYPSRCAGYSAGSAALAAAMQANAGLPAGERNALLAARAAAEAVCNGSNEQAGEAFASPPVSSTAGREFLSYMQAAHAFYGEHWAGARAGYAAGAKASDPWVRETASYMLARVDFAAAQAAAFGEYGDYEPAKVDAALAARGQAALVSYLKTWPAGRYAASVQGLVRRGLWLAGDYAGLSAEYARQLDSVKVTDPAAADLVQEIDNKLLFNSAAGQSEPRSVLLTATRDLLAMRAETDENGKVYQAPTLTAADLAAQAPLFAGAPELYGFLQANHAFYIGNDYRKVLQLVPDAAKQTSYSNLAFSRQVLRGQALAALGDRNEGGFWQQLLGGATGLWQRPTAELGLAMNWERSGKLADVFAPGSPIRETMIRRQLLIHSASPAILRTAAADRARPQYEGDLATLVLLYKDLSRGSYSAFGTDRALVRSNADTQSGLWYIAEQEALPLGVFSKGKWSDGYVCPAIEVTARTLAANPQAVGARLCLGDFWRLNGFDSFTEADVLNKRDELGGAANLFPGSPLARGDVYQSVIADPAAAGADKAYALYRAVQCYAPGGNNSCGGKEVSKAQRKGWFDRLKRDYPTSTWAKKSRFFW